jgi:aminoglycoside 6'-N-acetyltransferase I
MNIIDLPSDNQGIIRQTAQMLVEGFKTHWPNAWPDLGSELEEVQESFGQDKISRVGLNEDGFVLGWIGAIPEYDGHAWNLHPLVVYPLHQAMGIGCALVEDLEGIVHQRGGTTTYPSTNDKDSMTSLADIDLYPDVFQHIAAIKNLKTTPTRN